VAFESDEELARRFSGECRRFTNNTKTSLEELKKDFMDVRQNGFATDLEEFEEGLRCIASPIRDYTRKVVGAVSVSGPAHRLPDDRIVEVVAPDVIRAAAALSARLGYRE
jgi:IclR family KDG regulon transcriptional repressor